MQECSVWIFSMHIEDNLLKYMGDHPYCEVHGCRKYCGSLQPHHITTQGAGGSDDDENLMRLCMPHHREVHNSVKRFCIKYKVYKIRSILMMKLKWSDKDQEEFDRCTQ